MWRAWFVTASVTALWKHSLSAQYVAETFVLPYLKEAIFSWVSDCQFTFVIALPHCCGHIRSILIRSDPQGWAHIMERCERQARCESEIARLLCFQAQFTLSAQVIAFTIQREAQKHPLDKCSQWRCVTAAVAHTAMCVKGLMGGQL